MEEKRKITSGNKIPGCEKLTRPEEIQGLSKYLGAIRDTQEKWISENMPDSPLAGPEDAKLKEIKLPDKRLKLDGNKEVVLPNHRKHLDTEQELHLPFGKEKLDVPDQGLKVDKIGLDIGKEPELPKDKELIHPKDPTLPDQLERIHVEDPKLIQGKERLVVDDLVELPKTALGLHVEENIELPKEKEKIYPSDVSLPKSKETLNNIDDPELPNGVIDLQDLREISLPEGKEGIYPEHPKELPSDVIGINPEEPNDLRQHIEDLFAEEPNSLRQKRLGLHITEPDRLPWEVIEISPDHPKKLPDDRIDISVKEPDSLPKDRLDINPADPELPNSRIDIEPEDVELPNSRVDIKPDEPEELPADKIRIDPIDPKRIEEVIDSMSENELYEEVMNLLVSGKSGAETSGQGNVELAGIISAYLGDRTLTSQRAREVSQKIIDTLEKQKKLLNYAKIVGREGLDRENVLESRATQAKNLEIPEKDSVEAKYKDKEYRLTYGEENRVPGIKYQVPDGESVSKDPTNFLNPAVYDQDRYIRRLAELAADKGTDLISGALSGANSGLNAGKISSSARQYILKNTLMALVLARNKLERAMAVDRSRLPGGGAVLEGLQSLVQGGATGLLGGGIESTLRAGFNSLPKFIDGIANGIDTSRPQNRPKGDKNIWTGRIEGTKTNKLKRLNKESIVNALNKQQHRHNGLLSALDRTIDGLPEALADINETKTLADGLVVRNTNSNVSGLTQAAGVLRGLINESDNVLKSIKKGEVVFNTSDYFAGTGTALTLSDLCPYAKPDEIETIESFKDALLNSPYITTPRKLINRIDGNLTLDTNAYWEVIIEPYVDDNQNGGWSYLPSIGEINAENRVEHNHCTKYSKWIPINNFELQKSKLVSKSLGLFDGEINYPVSVEYTNELRISVVDDQYKSWRRYFQRCADVSTYFSEAHDAKFYSNDSGSYEAMPSAIDKSMICIAYYKNVTFRIRVYCMTPQYSTIKKFDLLCVLKDFSEEYSGEVEGGGSDLSISFSIVGENPEDPNVTKQNLASILPAVFKEKEKKKEVEAFTMTGDVKEIDDASVGIHTIVSEKSHGIVKLKV